MTLMPADGWFMASFDRYPDESPHDITVHRGPVIAWEMWEGETHAVAVALMHHEIVRVPARSLGVTLLDKQAECCSLVVVYRADDESHDDVANQLKHRINTSAPFLFKKAEIEMEVPDGA